MSLPSLCNPVADPSANSNIGLDFLWRANGFIQGDEQRRDEQRRQRRRHRNNYESAAMRESPSSAERDSPAHMGYSRQAELPAMQAGARASPMPDMLPAIPAGGRGSPMPDPGSPTGMEFRRDRQFPSQEQGSPTGMQPRRERQPPLPAEHPGSHAAQLRANASSPWPDRQLSTGYDSPAHIRPVQPRGQLPAMGPAPQRHSPTLETAEPGWSQHRTPEDSVSNLPGPRDYMDHGRWMSENRVSPEQRNYTEHDRSMPSNAPLPHVRMTLPPMAQGTTMGSDNMATLHTLQQNLQQNRLDPMQHNRGSSFPPLQERGLSRTPSLPSVQELPLQEVSAASQGSPRKALPPPQTVSQADSQMVTQPTPQVDQQMMPQAVSQRTGQVAPQMPPQAMPQAMPQTMPQAAAAPADPWAAPWNPGAQNAGQSSVDPWAAPWKPGASTGDVLVNMETNIKAMAVVDPRSAPWNPRSVQGMQASLLQQAVVSASPVDPWSAPWQPGRGAPADPASASAVDPWSAPWKPTRAADKVLAPLRDLQEHRGMTSVYPRSTSHSPDGAREVSPLRSPVPGVGPPSDSDFEQACQRDFGIGAVASHYAESPQPQWQGSYDSPPQQRGTELENSLMIRKGTNSAITACSSLDDPGKRQMAVERKGSAPESSHPAPHFTQSFVPAAAVNDRAPGTPMKRKSRIQETSSMGALPMLMPQGLR